MKYFLPALLLCIASLCTRAQDIVPNPAFGNKGFVFKASDKIGNIRFEQATSIVELPDGKLLLCVETSGTARLARYLPDGTLDKTFGKEGYSETIRSYQTRMMRTSEGQIMVAGMHALSSAQLIIARYDENGNFDKSFGSSGVKLIETAALRNELRSFMLQKDGKLLLAGQFAHSGKTEAFVIRLLQDGTPDNSFSDRSILKIDAPGVSIVSSIALSESAIFVGGTGNDNSPQGDFVILKYFENGEPDTRFGDNGVARIDIGTSDFLEAIALQTDGKIIAAGEVGDMFYNRQSFALVRLLADGKPDDTFSQTGVITTSFGSFNHSVRTLLVDANGGINVSVGQQGGFGPTIGFSRIGKDGSFDKSFGEEGKRLWNFNQVNANINSGLLKKDGSFVGVGVAYDYTVPSNTMDYMLLRLTAAGQPDEVFGNKGFVTAYLPGKSSFFDQPKLVSDGKILSRYTALDDPWIQGIMRYLPDGSVDESFADKGFLKTNNYLFFDELPDKRLVTLENVFNNTTYTSNIVMRRYTQEGQPDYTLGDNGQKVLPLYSRYSVNGIKVLPNGKILMTGYYMNQNYRQQGFLVRLDKDGNLDHQFGGNGEALFNLDRNEYVLQPVLQPDGKILVSGFFYSPPAYSMQFFVRRFTAEGQLDENFGNKGVIDGSYGLYSFANRMLVQPDGKLLISYVTTPDNLQYNGFLQRYNQNGFLDEGFGEKGRIKIAADGAELLKNGKILIPTRIVSQGQNDAALLLLNPNGSIDQGFGINGTKVFKLSGGDNSFGGLAVKDDKAYVSGSRTKDLDQDGFLGSFLIQYAAPGNNIVSGLSLVSASSGNDIEELKDGAVINYGSLPAGGLNIRANTTPEKTGSVVFELQGPLTRTHTENLLPYALFGDDMKGRYYSASLPTGEYTLTATPYSKAGGKGSAGMPLTIHFKVIYKAEVTRFMLVDAATGKNVREIKEGDVLDVFSLPARLNIRAYTAPARVGSMVLELSGANTHKQTQNGTPYTLFGDKGGNYYSGSLPVGEYTLTAMPYSESKGAGGNGSPLTVHFKVIDPTIVNLLYGLTANGGTNSMGVLFAVNAATSSYTKLKDFGWPDGNYPTGSLMQASDGKLYGMTGQGWSLPFGSIFSFDPKSNIFRSLQEFNHTNGAIPKGRLIQAKNGKFYGMTYFGGMGYGNIFYFDPTTNTITSVKEFNYEDGYAPNGSLVQASDGKFYGVTGSGGSNGFGVIFSFNPETNEFKKLQDFNGGNGGNPYGSLIQASDGKLYGMSHSGGYRGIIFSFDPITNTLTTRKHFSDAEGAYPWGDLIQAKDGKLYGMTNAGGSSNLGVLFSFDPVTNKYVKLLNFDGANGSNPVGNLMQASDGKLYGGTTYGGSSNLGVLFSFDPMTSTYAKLKDFNGADGAYLGHTSLIEISCKATIYYRDADGDGYGDLAKTIMECSTSVPEGFVAKGGDCNDADATVHSGSEGKGCSTGLSFTLVNATTGKDIVQLKEGAVLDLRSLPSGGVNIRISTTPTPIGSIVFALSGAQVHQQTESLLPYALFGDDTKGKYHAWTPLVGSYQLTATPYSGQKGSGVKDPASTINFSVVNGSYTFNSTAVQSNQEAIDITGVKTSLTAAPNPFSAASTVSFSVEKTSYATLGVFDQRGQEVARLYQGQMEKQRTYQATFDGKSLPAGVYVLRLMTEKEIKTAKVVLVR